MSNPNAVPVFDIETFDQSSWSLGFQAEIYTPEGTPTGTFFNLTDKIITLFIHKTFAEDFELSSEDPENEFGSFIEIDADPATGKFMATLGEDELKRVRIPNGAYRIECNAVDEDPLILMRGTFKVIPLMGDLI